jgi:hypothetical protein
MDILYKPPQFTFPRKGYTRAREDISSKEKNPAYSACACTQIDRRSDVFKFVSHSEKRCVCFNLLVDHAGTNEEMRSDKVHVFVALEKSRFRRDRAGVMCSGESGKLIYHKCEECNCTMPYDGATELFSWHCKRSEVRSYLKWLRKVKDDNAFHFNYLKDIPAAAKRMCEKRRARYLQSLVKVADVDVASAIAQYL